MRRPWLTAALLLLAACAPQGPAPVAPVPVTGLVTATTPVTAPASLVASPPAGRAGDEVRLSGRGYPPNGRVVLSFHDQRVGEVTADAAGGFADVPVRVPDSYRDVAPGAQYSITASSGPARARVPFVITRSG